MTLFPKREKRSYFTKEEHEKIMNNTVDICDCGHGDFEHRLLEDKTTNSECCECQCPYFNFQHKTTMKIYLKVDQERYSKFLGEL